MHVKIARILPPVPPKKYKKKAIPKALREQVWLSHMGKVFETKCKIVWCENRINAFDFQCGHNIPESKGGKTTIQNLIPICGRCNISMGDRYSIDEWNRKFSSPVPSSPVPPPIPRPLFSRYFCFKGRTTSVRNTKENKDSNNHKVDDV